MGAGLGARIGKSAPHLRISEQRTGEQLPILLRVKADSTQRLNVEDRRRSRSRAKVFVSSTGIQAKA